MKKQANVCSVCGHFLTLHNGKGCTVRFCDCSKRVKQ
jgi:hypothetical protein